MANGDQTRPNFFELAGVDTSITQTQTQNRPNFLALAQTEAPTQTTSMIRTEMPSFSEAFFGSLGEELTFGKLYNDPRLDADELSGAAKAGKMLGAGAAFFGVTALATVMTGGLGGLAMLGSSASLQQVLPMCPIAPQAFWRCGKPPLSSTASIILDQVATTQPRKWQMPSCVPCRTQ